MYFCVSVIDLPLLDDFSVGLWHCFDSVVFFVINFITDDLTLN